MLQIKAMNGEALMSPVEVPSVGDLQFNPLPDGLVGVDIEQGLVSVIQTPDKKPVLTKYGKLLKSLGRTDEVVRNESTKLTTLKVACQRGLKFTTSSEEVIDVYKRGPNSCMKDCDSVGIYATSDVAVAYIEDEEGHVIARTVVCINDSIGKHYVKTYGFGEPLEWLLKKDGFVKGDLEGCRLLRIEDDTGIKAPYLDGCAGIIDNGDYLEVVQFGADFTADQTSGYLNMRQCECCSDHISVDGEYYSEYLEQTLCEVCYEECHVCVDGTYYHTESDKIQQLENGDYVEEGDAVYVDYRDEWHHRDDCRYNSFIEEFVLNEDLL